MLAQYGKATLSASAVAEDSLVVVPDRLLKAGYIRIRIDQLTAKPVHYILSVEALELNESQAFCFPIWRSAVGDDLRTPDSARRITAALASIFQAAIAIKIRSLLSFQGTPPQRLS
jgi:hypothetical protein